MPQTLLALLALALSSLVVFNQQRLTKQAQTHMISSEIQLASSGLASDILEMIGARSFDENSTPERIHSAKAIPMVPSLFTSASGLGSAEPGECDLLAPSSGCDDIDDVTGIEDALYSVMLAEERSLDFEVSTSVIYVTDAEGKTKSTSPTRHKKVTLEVRATNDGVHVPPLVFARVYSYDPIKAEMDYERIYGPLGAGLGNSNDSGDGSGGSGGTQYIN